MVRTGPADFRLHLRLTVAAWVLWAGAGVAQGPPLSQIELPDGFSITVFADDVPGARSLAQSPGGTVFVGTRSTGAVYALIDSDNDGDADQTLQLASGLNSPNGVAFRGGALYVAEINRILRYDEIESRLASPPQPVVVTDALPTNTSHGWKFIRFGPDGRLYVPVGAPCNICSSADPYASILRLATDGSYEVVARGVRNTVGFDWHPGTGQLWFTENGRDWLGDDVPPDELNVVTANGQHFGYPFCHGGDIADPTYGSQRSCSEFQPPARRLGPHVAALGMRFYSGEMFPERYRGQIFIAEHGSWNRTDPIGYRVMAVHLNGNGQGARRRFVAGLGRPAGIDLPHCVHRRRAATTATATPATATPAAAAPAAAATATAATAAHATAAAAAATAAAAAPAAAAAAHAGPRTAGSPVRPGCRLQRGSVRRAYRRRGDVARPEQWNGGGATLGFR